MRKLQHLRIQVKLPVLTIGLVLACILLTGMVAFTHARDALIQTQEQRLKQTLAQKMQTAEQWASDLIHSTQMQASNPFSVTAMRGLRKGVSKAIGDGVDPVSSLPKAFRAERPVDALNAAAPTYAIMHRRYDPFFQDIVAQSDVSDIFLVNRDDRVIYASHSKEVIGAELSDTHDVLVSLSEARDALRGSDRRIGVSELPGGNSRQGASIVVARSILAEDGAELGTMGFVIPWNGLSEPLSRNWTLGETGFASLDIVNSGGWSTVASASFDRQPSKPSLTQSSDLSLLNANVRLSVGQSERELLGPILAVRKALVRDGAIAFAVAGTLAVFLSLSFTQPLGRIQTTVTAIRNGQHSVSIKDARRKDEFGGIARALQSFAKTLQENTRLVEESAFKNAAFEASSAPLVLVDRDMRIAFANSAFQGLVSENLEALNEMSIDVRPDGLVGRSMDLFQADPEHVRGILSVPERMPYRTEVEFGDRTIAMMFNQVRDGHGALLGFVVEWEDTTESRKQDALLEAINTRHIMAEFDMEGNLVFANDAFNGFCGHGPGDIIGKSLDVLLAPDDSRPLDNTDMDDLGDIPEQSRFVSPQTDHLMEGGMTTIMTRTGMPSRLLLIGQDITRDHKRLTRAEEEKEALIESQTAVVEALRDALARLSQGDLAEVIASEFPSNYDVLRTDFNSALERLSAALGLVVQNANAIRGEASDITTAADDLSRRTERQAATLEETAAALDQLTQNLRVAAGEAKLADEVVTRAREDAVESGQVVEQAVTAMAEIERSSNRISRIIEVIDDIAFQTNLLALNAGVEAARAGEAGRGFAVVASEVRALAQRSAGAAREITDLISISRDHVGQGVELVGKAGHALGGIVTSVADISQHVSEIAGSAAEQSRSIDEINAAVTNLDQVTQQNAAMFQETTAASHALRREAQQLSDTVGQFVLAEGLASDQTADIAIDDLEPATLPVAVGQDFSAPDSHGGWEEF